MDSAIEQALDHDPKPDKIIRHPVPCPQHAHGDAGRLDYRAKGWGWRVRCAVAACRDKAVWRETILCAGMPEAVTEFFCDGHLPKGIRPS